MKIIYSLPNSKFSFEQTNETALSNLNFILANSKGDFLNLGIQKNSSKFEGFNFTNSENGEIFKILDEFVFKKPVLSVEYFGTRCERKFEGGARDSFYLSPTGGFVYEIDNFNGSFFLDLDIKKQNDFDKWGRKYSVSTKDGILMIKYSKFLGEKLDYSIYFGIKTNSLPKKLIKEFIPKTYEYSKKRSSEFELYIFRLGKFSVKKSKKLICATGFSQEEVLKQISFLEQNRFELEEFDKKFISNLTLQKKFQIPLSLSVDTAYKLSINAIYNFTNSNPKTKIKTGSYAGFSWFAKTWTRDELVSIKAFINNGEYNLVYERLFDYLNRINPETGLLKRINETGSLESADGIFWLAKRFLDFITILDEKGRLFEVFSENDLKKVYLTLDSSFKKIVQKFWDRDLELLKAKNGDSWMDTINVEFPLDIQVQFLSLVSSLSFLSAILKIDKQNKFYLDFESGFRENIRERFLRKGNLYNEPFKDDIRSNIFLVYYFYSDLFDKSTWEGIFDKSLLHLKTSWGSISSLSKEDLQFSKNYTGENNLSYHNGDSWFWINNITGMVLEDLNSQKYRKIIRGILRYSTKDILEQGSIGFASEISSASKFKAEGCLSQCWSSATYLELVDKIFGKIE